MGGHGDNDSALVWPAGPGLYVKTMANLTRSPWQISACLSVSRGSIPDAHSHVARPARRQQRHCPQSATSPKLSADGQRTHVFQVCWTSARQGADVECRPECTERLSPNSGLPCARSAKWLRPPEEIGDQAPRGRCPN